MQIEDKAGVLVEALPYIQKFRNSIMVVKFGGSAMEDENLVRRTMQDIVMLEAIGIRPVVVHGGGKAISAALKECGIPVKFVNGLRYTCDKTIGVVDDVLHKVNAHLVELGKEFGGPVCGISGKTVLRAKRTLSTDPATGKQEDVGFVGEVTGVDTSAIMEALAKGLTPVLTPLGVGEDGQIYNINADTAACKIAEAIHARKLVFMSDVPGILADKDDESTLISSVCVSEAPQLMREGIISGGMIPKIECCVEAIRQGVDKVFILDGRVPHSLLIETLTNEGIGTMLYGG